MPVVTIRNLSDASLRAIKRRAARRGCSAEAELRDIIEVAVRPDTRLRPGSALTDAAAASADQ
ncbi:FitA-like ribbon-helix-helix domain-containing protein [Pararhizobium haloflavum]|uniref:FitA-like ribbon-helix-helix domain-containing protein n=1 Tax=Pararhizobium haloflavum TaxID=2037914 RepID=UPI001FE03D00|nr:plasmid stabilization protein [Pararhizobium haloflavum]